MSNNIAPIGQASSSPSQKPSNSAFKQQKLSAWQPILTVGTVLPTFFLVGVAFIPIGIGLLISSYQVQEYEVDYTSCEKIGSVLNDSEPHRCSELIAKNPNANCSCQIDVELETDYRRDVFIYYGLTNFYQNHRRYVKSRDDYQLLGHIRSGRECDPFAQRLDPKDGMMKPIVPCGAIANSLFNDTFCLERIIVDANNNPTYRKVPLLKTGIAWATDKNKFKNPPWPKGAKDLSGAFNGSVRPINWPRNVYDLDPSDLNNNGLQNEGLIVWMRTAAFPTFRKLYARIRHDIDDDINYQDGLPKGLYRLTIQYNFPVAGFKGQKRFIISNTSWLGGKNPFIGAVYILVGLFSLILSVVFLIIHKKFDSGSQTPYLN
ncbi:Cell cycle control protein 50A [Sarcoptes scabiei]|nr:Cell cycle control protein 50A [Sarcoptes scabiei]